MSHPKNNYGVGFAWTPSLARGIDEHLDSLTCIEIIAENFFDTGHDLLKKWGEKQIPVFVHGVALSIGSADGIDAKHLDKILRVADRVNTINISDHLGFCYSHGIETVQPAMLPFCSDAVTAVCRNIDFIQSRTKLPFLVENEANRFVYPHSEMSEPEFINQVLDRTGCGLILDLFNLYTNSVNFAVDERQWLEAVDLSQLGYIHIAGGRFDEDGFLCDSHNNVVPEPVWWMLENVLARSSPLAVIVERSDRSASLDTLLPEARCAASLMGNWRQEFIDRSSPTAEQTL